MFTSWYTVFTSLASDWAAFVVWVGAVVVACACVVACVVWAWVVAWVGSSFLPCPHAASKKPAVAKSVSCLILYS